MRLGPEVAIAWLVVAILFGCILFGCRSLPPKATPAVIYRDVRDVHLCSRCGREIPFRAWEAGDFVGAEGDALHFSCALPEDPDDCGRPPQG